MKIKTKKVALITGASSGMGKITAIKLQKLGFTVYCGARRTELMNELEQYGIYTMYLDITDENSMKNCVEAVLRNEGQIDVLVNNAGYGSAGSIEQIPMDEIRHQFEVNVFGLGRMIQLVLPSMRNKKSGTIINVSSMGGRFSSPFCGWYHASKYAVEAISDALRMETLAYGIKTVLIEPGMIQTDWGVIAAKHIRLYSCQGEYHKNGEAVAAYYEKRYASKKRVLSSPDVVAKTIARAAMSCCPRPRYAVGRNATLFLFLKHILSDRLFQLVTRSSMGVR